MIIIVGPSYKEDFFMYVQGINLKFGHVIWTFLDVHVLTVCSFLCLLLAASQQGGQFEKEIG